MGFIKNSETVDFCGIKQVWILKRTQIDLLNSLILHFEACIHRSIEFRSVSLNLSSVFWLSAGNTAFFAEAALRSRWVVLTGFGCCCHDYCNTAAHTANWAHAYFQTITSICDGIPTSINLQKKFVPRTIFQLFYSLVELCASRRCNCAGPPPPYDLIRDRYYVVAWRYHVMGMVLGLYADEAYLFLHDHAMDWHVQWEGCFSCAARFIQCSLYCNSRGSVGSTGLFCFGRTRACSRVVNFTFFVGTTPPPPTALPLHPSHHTLQCLRA